LDASLDAWDSEAGRSVAVSVLGSEFLVTRSSLIVLCESEVGLNSNWEFHARFTILSTIVVAF
jgi:hypothetical protein